MRHIITFLITAVVTAGLAAAPIHQAAKAGNTGQVKKLIEEGADINSQDDFGNTPLAVAASNGNAAVVRLLLNQGAELPSKGMTPLHEAAKLGHAGVVEALLEGGADVNALAFGKTALDFAKINKQTAVVEILENNGGKPGEKLQGDNDNNESSNN